MPPVLPVYNAPASLVEIEGSGDVEITPEGLRGTRKAVVNYADLNSALVFLLGGIVKTDNNEVINTAQPWPGIPQLMVESIRATPAGKTGNSSWSSGVIPCTYYKLELQYTTAAFQSQNSQDNEKETPENEDYLIQEVDYSCDTIVIPVKVTDTNASAQTSTRETKVYVRLPRVEYTATIPKVRSPKFSTILDLNGKINTKVVFGGAIGTVLFDGPKLSNTISSMNDPAWKFAMKFIYNPKGWNKTLHPETLKWVDATALDGGTQKLYESGDLSLLWKRT